MNDLATLTAQPKTILVDGKEYKVYPLDLGDFGHLQAWIDNQFPNPIDVVKKTIDSGDYSMSHQQFLFREALTLASSPRHLIGTPEADQLLTSVEGSKEVLFLSIRKGDPNFTKEDSEKLFAKMNFADAQFIAHATNLDMVATDPKPDEPKLTPPGSESGVQASRNQRRDRRKRTGGGSSTPR